jgi:hypothetical protein
MPDWSRRRALHAIASAGTLALAGCSAEHSSEQESHIHSRGERVTDYEYRQVRSPAVRPLVSEPERDDGGDESESTETPDATQRLGLYGHVTSSDELAEYSFARDVSAGERLARFCGATDFETQSLFVHQHVVGACYTHELVDVRRKEDSVRVDFCRSLRPADVACEADDDDVVGSVVRLPFPGDRFNGFGVGHSGSCPPWMEGGAATGSGGADANGGDGA